jgi:hypothetical protein
MNTNLLATLGTNSSNVLTVALDDRTVDNESWSAAVLEFLTHKLLDQVILGRNRETKGLERSGSLGRQGEDHI